MEKRYRYATIVLQNFIVRKENPMKKTCKRILAILLTAMLCLGASAISGAAAPVSAKQYRAPSALGGPKYFSGAAAQAAMEDSFTVKTNPGISWNPYSDITDFSGLVVTVSGENYPAPTDIEYDVAVNEKLGEGKVIWEFWLSPYEYWDGESASTQAMLYLSANKFSDFKVEYTDPDSGKEYGYYETIDSVFFASKEVTVAVNDVNPDIDLTSATPLALNTPTAVNIPKPAEDDEPEFKLFKFVPSASGYYSFKSTGAKFEEQWSDREGNWIWIDGVDPLAILLDANGMEITANDDVWDSYDFAVYSYLEAGQSYYLYTCAYPFGEYTVTAAKYDSVLVAPKSVKLNYHEILDIAPLLEGSSWSWETDDMEVHFEGNVIDIDWGYYALYGYARGSETITIVAPDGNSVDVKVTVEYTFAQWLCVIFLGGWAWMKYTSVGEFDLGYEIERLWRYIRFGY